MEFESADPSVVRSVKQRDLLNAWLRILGKGDALPDIEDYRPDRVTDEMPDMMRFNVVGSGAGPRFLITQEGARLTATYGNEHIDPDKRTNRYLDDAIGPVRYGRVVASYLTCVERKRPTYAVAMVRDEDGKEVAYERLLLPFGNANAVTQIVGSYKAISIDGGFKIRDLMSIDAAAAPQSVIRAVIDLDLVRSAVTRRASSDDVIELS
jgi:hypothetical protein